MHDGIFNLLFLRVESSFKVCQSRYQFIKALSLLQDLFVCVVSNNVFQNSSFPLTFSGVIYKAYCFVLTQVLSKVGVH